MFYRHNVVLVVMSLSTLYVIICSCVVVVMTICARSMSDIFDCLISK